MKPEKLYKKIEIVVKCDTYGSLESVLSSIEQLSEHEMEIKPIHSGVGAINKSDILMAQTGSKLVIGFNVDILPGLDSLIRQYDIEVRIYKVIYRLIEELKNIPKISTDQSVHERITGEAKVIALFKSRRKGIIIGCQVNRGVLSSGKKFRIISAMGIIYIGRIESLHIGRDTVNVARAGQ